jgi:hypothetical protein
MRNKLHLVQALTLLGLALAATPAWALICTPINGVCRTTYRYEECDGEPLPQQPLSTSSVPSGADPNALPSGCRCVIDYVENKPAGTPCTADTDPCTSDVCNGSGLCTHVATGGKVCGAACIAQSSCCTSADCSSVANGSGSCDTPGAMCTITCNGGYKVCGPGCIPVAQCCTDADCPSDPANHRRGVCGGGSCAFACEAGYKPCGATCIPNAQCCGNSDCASPPNGCYKASGTCSAGACSYALNDGAACNADNDACTPNDRCQGGTCVADTANTVRCVKRECHTAPVCSKVTGNCVDAALANGAGCGGNQCTTAGTCTGGVCSGMSTDCSADSEECKVGICDPSFPGTPGMPSTYCTTLNKMNGLACSVADKCQLMAACSGGICVGTTKACSPSAECRVAMCNSTTGDCEESIAPVGTPCEAKGACLQNPSCDATGACVGVTVPDGTPCASDACADSACVTGQCICIVRPADAQPLLPGTAADMGVTGGEDDDDGCALVGGPRADLAWLVVIAMLLVRRRRRTT